MHYLSFIVHICKSIMVPVVVPHLVRLNEVRFPFN